MKISCVSYISAYMPMPGVGSNLPYPAAQPPATSGYPPYPTQPPAYTATSTPYPVYPPTSTSGAHPTMPQLSGAYPPPYTAGMPYTAYPPVTSNPSTQVSTQVVCAVNFLDSYDMICFVLVFGLQIREGGGFISRI